MSPSTSATAAADSNATMYCRSLVTTWKYSLIVGLGAILFGIDQGAMTGVLAMKQFLMEFGHYDPVLKDYSMHPQDQTIIFGALLGPCVISSFLSGPLGARWGRRVGLLTCAIASIIGPIIQALAPNIGIIALGRAFTGLGVGFAANFCVTYWSETTPPQFRGMVVMIYQGFINAATFVASSMNQGTHDLNNRWAWKSPILIMIAGPLALLVCVPFIPESPRWLVTQGRIDEAQKMLQKIRGPTWPEEDIAEEIQEIETMEAVDRQLENSATYWDCFKGTNHRRTRIVIMTMFCQQFTGIAFIIGYSTYFFYMSGVKNPFTVTVITSVCGMAGSVSAFPLIKFVGRRPLMIVGGAVCALSMLTFAIVGTIAPNSNAASKCLVTFTSLYIFSFGATWGPVTWAVVGEIPSNQLRSKTLSLGNMVSWMCTTFIACGTPYLLSDSYINIGAKMGFIFGGCTVLSTIWTILYLPETKDRTLEEIDEMFLNKAAARKFKSYTCVMADGGASDEKKIAQAEEGGDIVQVESVNLSK